MALVCVLIGIPLARFPVPYLITLAACMCSLDLIPYLYHSAFHPLRFEYGKVADGQNGRAG
jgi:hypothetical protein